MKYSIKKIIAVIALTNLTGLANAAVNPASPTAGSSGGPGLANLTINATVGALFQISGLTDITFPAYTGSGVWSASDAFCVYTNGAAGFYHVTVTGSSGAGAGFNLNNGTNTIPYTVDYTDATPTTTVGLTSGTMVVAAQKGHATLTNCGGNNSTVTINISADEASAAPASVTAYTGVLTFLVAP